MIRGNIGRSTFSAACEAESHLMTRSCFSGHRLLWYEERELGFPRARVGSITTHA
jgi:hypothetical protein